MKRHLRKTTHTLTLLFVAIGLTANTLGEGEYEWRYFTKIKNSESGELLKKTITAQIKIVSRIGDQRFKAISRNADGDANSRPFVLTASDFSNDDQKYLEQWNPDLAVDLSDYPIETILTQSGYTKVPLPKRNNQFEVRAEINGKPVVFILDTGAQGTVLTADAARRLGLDDGREVGQGVGIGGKPVALFESGIQEFKVGDYQIAKKKIHYCEMGFGKNGSASMKDGLFGFEDINLLNAIIDYGKEAIYIRPDRPE
ncbi:MAG: retropepsin-like aspartic protease [Verrucomicrobiota bacterium]